MKDNLFHIVPYTQSSISPHTLYLFACLFVFNLEVDKVIALKTLLLQLFLVYLLVFYKENVFNF